MPVIIYKSMIELTRTDCHRDYGPYLSQAVAILFQQYVQQYAFSYKNTLLLVGASNWVSGHLTKLQISTAWNTLAALLAWIPINTAILFIGDNKALLPV